MIGSPFGPTGTTVITCVAGGSRAGAASGDAVESSDLLWQKVFDVNVMSAVQLSRHYPPTMVESGWGRVVLIGTEVALMPDPQ